MCFFFGFVLSISIKPFKGGQHTRLQKCEKGLKKMEIIGRLRWKIVTFSIYQSVDNRNECNVIRIWAFHGSMRTLAFKNEEQNGNKYQIGVLFQGKESIIRMYRNGVWLYYTVCNGILESFIFDFASSNPMRKRALQQLKISQMSWTLGYSWNAQTGRV